MISSIKNQKFKKSRKYNKKGFGGVASTLIMFIAIVSITTGIVISFMKYVDNAEDSVAVKNDFLQKKLETEIDIINIVYDSDLDKVKIYFRNLGNTQLASKYFTTFVDDKYITEFVIKNPETDDVLKLVDSQEVGVVFVNETLESGSHIVKLVSQYGVGDKMGFNI